MRAGGSGGTRGGEAGTRAGFARGDTADAGHSIVGAWMLGISRGSKVRLLRGARLRIHMRSLVTVWNRTGAIFGHESTSAAPMSAMQYGGTSDQADVKLGVVGKGPDVRPSHGG